MAFDGKDFLMLASYLLGLPAPQYSLETAQRTSVSRAYYAAFWQARDYVRTVGGHVLTGSSQDHRGVRSYLRQMGLSSTADDLDWLRTLRNQCEYESQVANLNDLAKDAIETTEIVIQICSI